MNNDFIDPDKYECYKCPLYRMEYFEYLYSTSLCCLVCRIKKIIKKMVLESWIGRTITKILDGLCKTNK